jgi:hypothetical protein
VKRSSKVVLIKACEKRCKNLWGYLTVASGFLPPFSFYKLSIR